MNSFAKKSLWVAAAAAAFYSTWMYVGRPAAVATTTSGPVVRAKAPGDIVAAGLVEPVSEELKLGSEMDGKLRSVPVEEGQRVRRGQVVATLVNDDFAARVAIAEAAVAERRVELDRIEAGNRKQERRESTAAVREAEAVLANADAEKRRRAQLLDRGAIARSEYEVAEREAAVAAARLDAVKERSSLVYEGYRVEDRRRAEAELARAKAQLAEARAMLAKTIIVAPVDGVVLRKKLRAGESVSGKGDPPVVTIGDTSRLRVRADIDETDVARLAVGQVAYVTAPAFGDKKFVGRVIRIGEILGRKNIRTDEPTERVDKKILETLIELEPGQQLPIGLRVDAFIQAGDGKAQGGRS